MNKEAVIREYKKLVDELGEQPHEVVLSAGAALVMMGVRDETQDLDVDVRTNIFKWLSNGREIVQEENCSPRIQYRKGVAIHEFSENTGVVCIAGVWMYSPGELLIQKRYLANMPNRRFGKREKDLFEITQLETLKRMPQGLTARMT